MAEEHQGWPVKWNDGRVLSPIREETIPGIDRTMSDEVKSKGYKIVYGDEDLTVLNEVVSDLEKTNPLDKKVNLREAIKPLPAEDVKCLMSVDRYCSTEMRQVKGVLIQALKDDCEKCSNEEKDNAGKVAASMMANDPIAWKLFLTRSTLQNRPQKEPLNVENPKLRLVGEPEIVSSKYKYAIPGVKVRVKRYIAEKIL
ncbi:hypothetical protein evm_002584 [Chilo suppressalis]|nr:hypothetical protein evm_002584 [Chilo suppressalis]